MGPAVPLLAVPFCAGAVLALCWMTRRLPAGGSGPWNGLAAVFVIPPLAIGGWLASLQALTHATYVCLACGRTEEQYRFADFVCSRTLHDSGDEYVRRFTPGAAPGHAHDWHVESCLRRASGRVECNEQRIEGWFRVLPLLKDRAAAEQLFRAAQALPREERCGLMDQVGMGVRSECERGHQDLDEAFRS